jgi:hypothetical protein
METYDPDKYLLRDRDSIYGSLFVQRPWPWSVRDQPTRLTTELSELRDEASMSF